MPAGTPEYRLRFRDPGARVCASTSAPIEGPSIVGSDEVPVLCGESGRDGILLDVTNHSTNVVDAVEADFPLGSGHVRLL